MGFILFSFQIGLLWYCLRNIALSCFQVIGAVLNSIGIGGQNTSSIPNATQTSAVSITFCLKGLPCIAMFSIICVIYWFNQVHNLFVAWVLNFLLYDFSCNIAKLFLRLLHETATCFSIYFRWLVFLSVQTFHLFFLVLFLNLVDLCFSL